MQLRVRNLTLTLDRRTVLRGLDFDLAAGEVLGVIGPNGAGKTSLLRALAGLLPATTGSVLLDGEPLLARPARERARLVGYLPQFPRLEWPLPVRDAVALGRQALGLADPAGVAVDTALARFELAGLAMVDATRLSGGEQMRVHLARLAAGDHRLLLVDEPTASLEPRHQLQVLAQLRDLARSGCALLLVLHDLPLAARFCDRVLVLADGTRQVQGPPQEVLDDRLLEAVFRVSGERNAAGSLVALREL